MNTTAPVSAPAVPSHVSVINPREESYVSVFDACIELRTYFDSFPKRVRDDLHISVGLGAARFGIMLNPDQADAFAAAIVSHAAHLRAGAIRHAEQAAEAAK